jgi:hypothetical protein
LKQKILVWGIFIMSGDTLGTMNVILDVVLVLAAIWMILAARGVGGIFGRTLTLIVVGAIILGIAHLLATFGTQVLRWDGAFNNFVHRLIVLAGFVFLVFGFRNLSEIKR